MTTITVRKGMCQIKTTLYGDVTPERYQRERAEAAHRADMLDDTWKRQWAAREDAREAREAAFNMDLIRKGVRLSEADATDIFGDK